MSDDLGSDDFGFDTFGFDALVGILVYVLVDTLDALDGVTGAVFPVVRTGRHALVIKKSKLPKNPPITKNQSK